MGFSRQEYWSGLPFPPPGNLPNPGIEPVSLMSPALVGRFFMTTATSVQFSHSVVSNSLQPHKLQQAGLRVHHQLLEFSQNNVHWVSDAFQPSHPLSSPSSAPQSLTASESFPMSQLFTWGGQNIGISALASFLPKNTQDWSPLRWLVGSPCSPRNCQESSPTPQFKSNNSLAISFLHSPTLTSIHNHWKNHSLD